MGCLDEQSQAVHPFRPDMLVIQGAQVRPRAEGYQVNLLKC